MTDTLILPIVIAGERVEPDGDAYEFTFEETNTKIVLAKPPPQDLERAVSSNALAGLRELSIDELTAFFADVGEMWADANNPWRQRAVEWGARVTGYSPAMVQWDASFLADSLFRQKQYDTLETDLGDPSLLDDWNRHKATLLRCWPQGIITHVMVGNVPMASLFTLWRSLVTKNVTVTKVPRRDPVSALCFANCILDMEPQHPVSKALSVLYWEAGSDLENWLLETSNAVSVWGRGPSVESIKQKIPCGTEFIEFGPKRSFSLVLDGVTDWDTIGMLIAYDMVMYDQEGCFSPQEAYIVGDPDQFVDALAMWLTKAAEAVPRRHIGIDGETHVTRTRMEAMGEGWHVVAPPTTDWTIVVTDGVTKIPDHPLSRLLYVHPAESFDAVVSTVDRNVQSVSVAPWEKVTDVANKLTAAGATRIVPSGHLGIIRPGFVHDGFHPMRRMVRWVTIERGFEQRYRFRPRSLGDETERIRELLGG